jgi:two-component system, OmpR family, KDP operon response regulator KdpE
MSDSGPRALVVDDERSIRRFLHASLTAHGYVVDEAETGAGALTAAAERHPDVIILDLGLPDISGTLVTRRLREWTTIPIIVLSVRESEADKIEALDAGADDYITKPFGVGELLARLRAALRHTLPQSGEAVFTTGDLLVDLGKRVVQVAGRDIQLTPTEYEILRVLVNHAGQVLTHRQLLREVWGPGYADDAHLLRVNISNLRHKLEPQPALQQYIITEPGVGYRLRTIS